MATNKRAMQDMFASDEWSAVRFIIEERHGVAITSLKHAELDKVRELQGRIATYEEILSLEESLVKNFDAYFPKEDE